MLHGTLPRPFLVTGLDYLGRNYYDDEDHRPSYHPSSFYPPPFEEHRFPRVTEHRLHRGFPAWHQPATDSPPSPLDLSLKATKSVPDDLHELKVERVDGTEVERLAARYDDRIDVVDKSAGLVSSPTHRHREEEDHNRYRRLLVVEESRVSISPRRRWMESASRVDDDDEEPRRVPSGDNRDEEEDLIFESLEGNAKLRNYHRPEDGGPTWSPGDDERRGHCEDKLASTMVPGSSDIRYQSVAGYRQQLLLQTPHQHHLQGIQAPMTPPSTPSPPQCPRKRQREEGTSGSPVLVVDRGLHPVPTSEISPRSKKKHARRLKFAEDTSSPVSGTVILGANEAVGEPVPPPGGQQSSSIVEKSPRLRKKHSRRLKFDEDTSSPVSGTVILGPDSAIVSGDIDPAFNVVEVTDEARADLAKIENRLGPYECRLCRKLHEDAFQLAQHRCSRIAHLEYRCPECDKRFSCPANLASHRRWHKPRQTARTSSSETGDPDLDPEAKDTWVGKQPATEKRERINGDANNDNDEPMVVPVVGDPSHPRGGANTGNGASTYDVERVLPPNAVGHLAVAPLALEMP